MSKLISIIVPCYNQSEYLDECLSSVLSQTYENWECVIVDDGSPDNTDKVATIWTKRDKRFKYVKKENGGLSSARNFGIRNSQGYFILPLDADDMIGENYLELASNAFELNSDIKLVYGKAKKFGIENNIWELSEYNYASLLEGNMVYCSACFKRTDFEKTQGYDENLKTGYEDWEFWLQLLDKSSKIFFIKTEVVFYYRIKKTSMLKEIDDEISQNLRIYIYQKHRNIFTDYWGDPIKIKRENSILQSMYKNSLTYKVGALVTYPLKKLRMILSSI